MLQPCYFLSTTNFAAATLEVATVLLKVTTTVTDQQAFLTYGLNLHAADQRDVQPPQ